jgi:hypothetical protein
MIVMTFHARSYRLALAPLALLLTTAAHAEDKRKAELVGMLMMYKKNCTTPLTATATGALNKYILEVEEAAIKQAAAKVVADMNRVGVGPWCRTATKVIGTVSRKYEK